MANAIKGFVSRIKQAGRPASDEGFEHAPEGKLFPKTDPVVDGDDCSHDCASCSIAYPAKFSIDESDRLYGHVKGWQTHLIVATGKTDWVRNVEDEKGSIMESMAKHNSSITTGKMMLSASNMPVPDGKNHVPDSTTVLLLPAFTYIDNVTQENTPQVISSFINNAPTNTTPFDQSLPLSLSPPDSNTNGREGDLLSQLKLRTCPHRYLILLCSQKTRDARCGQSAPLLRKEFERLLRPLGLYRDLHDERPGGVGIFFISHVGGHKYSANVMIYRRGDAQAPREPNGKANGTESTVTDAPTMPAVIPGQGEASQCIWLARVRPDECENIIKYTILQGKVVKPETQLRGGFDREKRLTSW